MPQTIITKEMLEKALELLEIACKEQISGHIIVLSPEGPTVLSRNFGKHPSNANHDRALVVADVLWRNRVNSCYVVSLSSSKPKYDEYLSEFFISIIKVMLFFQGESSENLFS